MPETGKNISHYLIVEKTCKGGTGARYRDGIQKGKG
jgi:hypothetical protein